MANRTIQLTDRLYEYLLRVSLREPPVLRRLREETARLPNPMMQIAPDQGQFMGLLVELMGARRAIEVGVFTGYSSICVALALPPDGQLVACDINEQWTGIARRYWREAGVEDKIDLRLAPALETLDALLAVGEAGRFDFAFIDADKTGYDQYYERVLALLRPGGVLMLDNVLRDGKVADPENTEADTEAIRAINLKTAADERITMSLAPIGDGLCVARKR